MASGEKSNTWERSQSELDLKHSEKVIGKAGSLEYADKSG